jgi:hypothetical protein
VKAPAKGAVNFAFGIYEEFVAFQTKGLRPKFFSFCELVAQSAHENGIHQLGFIFATEWQRGVKIRMSYGNVNRLEMILSLPGHCALYTINVETAREEEWDELPLFYELDCKTTSSATGGGSSEPADSPSSTPLPDLGATAPSARKVTPTKELTILPQRAKCHHD